MRRTSNLGGLCTTLLMVATSCFSKPDAPAASDGRVDGAPVDAMVDAAQPPETPIDPRGPQRLAAGGQHVCSIDNAGSLTCWGRNVDGELGLPGSEPQNEPVRIGDPGGWTSIAAGLGHTCGIRSGTVYCWGRNASDQAGGASQTTLSPTPVDLPGNFQATAVFAEDDLSCAVGSQGGAATTYCWGEISSDGNNSYTTLRAEAALMPFQIGSLTANPAGTRWTKIVAGSTQRCALRDNGAVFCWGGNGAGQAGQPASPQVMPLNAQRVGPLLTFVDIAAGVHTSCGITSNNEIYCWGQGESIAPARGNAHLPALIPGVAGRLPRAVSIGFYHACVSFVDGGAACWGQDENGAMGFQNRYLEGFANPRDRPRAINLQPGGVAPAVVSLVAAEYFTCARVATGQPVRCWGSNDFAQLGLGIRAQRSTLAAPAVELPIGGRIDSLVAGTVHVCSRIFDSANNRTTNSCWGRNFESQVDGLPQANDANVMYAVPAVSNYVSTAIVAGGANSCDIRALNGVPGKRMTCWGENGLSQLGTGNAATFFDNDAPMASTHTWVDAATNGGATCGLLRDEGAINPANAVDAECWGQRFGSGTANATHYNISTDLIGPVTWEKIALGSDFGMALVKSETQRKIVTWGASRSGQLGSGVARQNAVGILDVPSNAMDVSLAPAGADGHHACVAWQNPATIKCWGQNNQGQAGLPVNNPAVALVNDIVLPGGATARSIVAAADHTCALTAGSPGRVYCWGSPGEMGMQGNQISLGQVPVEFAVSANNWRLLATGRHHTCVASAGTSTVPARVHCWGTSEFGQHGDSSRYHPDPVAAMVAR